MNKSTFTARRKGKYCAVIVIKFWEGNPYEDHSQTGRQDHRQKDEIHEVSDGYARNFLFPRNLAAPRMPQR